jgi:hypothetical protein
VGDRHADVTQVPGHLEGIVGCVWRTGGGECVVQDPLIGVEVAGEQVGWCIIRVLHQVAISFGGTIPGNSDLALGILILRPPRLVRDN